MGVLLFLSTVAAVTVVSRLLARRSVRRSVGRHLLAVLRSIHLLPPAREVSTHRPIEVVAREARRLGRLYRSTRTGHSFARADGIRRAYDGVLAEGCEALGLPHLLAVLRDGEELDAERTRVERLLHVWGIEIGEAA